MEYTTAKRLRPIGADQHIDAETLFKIKAFRFLSVADDDVDVLEP